MIEIPAIAQAAEGVGTAKQCDECRYRQLERGTVVRPARNPYRGQQAADNQQSGPQ